jgi:hypothetical protein
MLPEELIPQTIDEKTSGAIMHFIPFKKSNRKGLIVVANSGK